MAQYRPKRKVEAIQWNGIYGDNFEEVQKFLGSNFTLDFSRDPKGELKIESFLGKNKTEEKVSVGDYIIKGYEGIRSCDAEFFERFYEEI